MALCVPQVCNTALLDMLRYNEAKDLAKNLEKQANKVQAEAEEAGDKALKIFANLTSLPLVDTDTLEVTADMKWFSAHILLHSA